ncbi:MAG: hypothetical protein ACKOXO_01740 [Cyanobium sp.]
MPPLHRSQAILPITRSLLLNALLSAATLLAPALAQAGIQFENCVGAADGTISCDTAPTGDTALDAAAARAGLFNQASPGWSEFDPDQGYAEDLGDAED